MNVEKLVTMDVGSPEVPANQVPMSGTFEKAGSPSGTFMRVSPSGSSVGTIGEGQVWAVNLMNGEIWSFDGGGTVSLRKYKAVPEA